MGLTIERDSFEEADFERFSARLQTQLEALERVLGDPSFGAGPSSIGAEVELSLVDANARPLGVNDEVLARANDRRLSLELDRFNLEINADPSPLEGRPFDALESQLGETLAKVQGAAAALGGRAVLIGILPTLTPDDVAQGALSDANRYRALSAGLRRLRGEPFDVRVRGEDEVTFASDNIALEGANTSFQIHLRVDADRFAAAYNAAQLASAVALAAAVNSPTLFGARLWSETRIALFRQSVDDRAAAAPDDWRPARVSFGHGWVRRQAYELFAESVSMHPPLIPVCGDEDAHHAVDQGRPPLLAELRLHQGTVWRWNRAVYDPTAGGHLRIEFRALPSGPTVPDMVANAAFLLGLTLGLEPSIEHLLSRITFGQARQNFYAAAQHGLDAELLWPGPTAPLRRVRAADLALELLPLAARGLERHGVATSDAAPRLALLRERLERRQTGAAWQRAALADLGKTLGKRASTAAMLEAYLAHGRTGAPVHGWPLR
ncbi:MAG: hypothetical protein U0414_06885 [Polyangiaceae bacterium]